MKYFLKNALPGIPLVFCQFYLLKDNSKIVRPFLAATGMNGLIKVLPPPPFQLIILKQNEYGLRFFFLYPSYVFRFSATPFEYVFYSNKSNSLIEFEIMGKGLAYQDAQKYLSY